MFQPNLMTHSQLIKKSKKTSKSLINNIIRFTHAFHFHVTKKKINCNFNIHTNIWKNEKSLNFFTSTM